VHIYVNGTNDGQRGRGRYVPGEQVTGGGRNKLGSLFDQAPLQISQYGKDYARFQTESDLNRQALEDPKNPCDVANGLFKGSKDCSALRSDKGILKIGYCHYRTDMFKRGKCITRLRSCKGLSQMICGEQTGAYDGSPDGKYTGEVSCYWDSRSEVCKERKSCFQGGKFGCRQRYIKGEQCKRCTGKKKRRKGRSSREEMDYDYETSDEPVEKFMDYKQDFNSLATAGGWMRQDCANPDWQKSPFCNCVATCSPGDLACEGDCNASYGGIGASSQMGVMGKRFEDSVPLAPQDTGFQG